MNYKVFSHFWSSGTKEWLANAQFKDTLGELHRVSDICELRKNYTRIIYHNYEEIKKIVKQNYFKSNLHIALSRFKRASVLIYAIIEADPIVYKKDYLESNTYFLKQRLALYLAFISILVDYDSQAVLDAWNKARQENPDVTVFGANTLGIEEDQDDFLTSFYKDLEFAEIYNNYDVLAIANILGLIVEQSSILKPEMLITHKKSK